MKSLDVCIVIILFVSASCQNLIENQYRLSKDVFPSNYNITIRPYFLPEDGDKRFTFYGETKIVIKTEIPHVRVFALHAQNLSLVETDFFSIEGKSIKFTKKYNELTHKLVLILEESLEQDLEYVISFKYTGLIYDDFEGLFWRSYKDASSSDKLVLATQMQRIYARKLFPCFDEPGFKAYFDIHISRPRNYRSFSNTVLISTTIDSHGENRYIDHFKTTPYMSTYLVAMLIAEYVPRTDSNQMLFILSRPEFYNKTEFSQKIALKLLNEYSQLLGVSYVDLGNSILQKASLPEFLHNGMENWGLTLYKDQVLIFEDGYTDLFGKQYSASVISHETSHNWFGNSITFEWWGYFWLNEAFARFYQYFLTQKVFPEYELDKQFTVDQMHSIFDKDASNDTQPLSESNINTPLDIEKKFSSITYVKGASVVRMIQHAMSENKFMMAMRDYVKSNLHSSVNPSHLLKQLKNHWPTFPRVNIDTFFHDWTEEVGYPLLNVTLSPNNLNVKIQQTRFLLDHDDGSDPDIQYTIPLTYTTNINTDFNNTFPKLYFNKNQQQIVLDFQEPIQWIIFNIQQNGYYRVMYDSNLNNRLYKALLENNWSGIHEINRAQFVDDLFALGRIGHYAYDEIFEWLEYLQTETHFTPWKAALKGFKFIGWLLTPAQHLNYGKYMLNITSKVFNKLGTNASAGESTLDVYNRNQILNVNCNYGREECTRFIQNKLEEYLKNGKMIQVDIRETVYCNGMRDASEEDFEKLLKKFKSEEVPKEKLRIRYGLGCTRNLNNLRKFFEIILSDEVPVKDKDDVTTSMVKENPTNVWPVYELVTTRATELANSSDSWSKAARTIAKVAAHLTTKGERDKFEEFINSSRESFGSASLILLDALQDLDYKLKWSKTHLDSLMQFLNRKFN